MREPSIALAHSIRGWAQALHFFIMDHGGAIVRGYVMSAEDALDEGYDVLVVDDITSFLSARLVSSLRSAGVRIVGVYDEADSNGAGRQRLLEIGVDEAIPASMPPGHFVETITRLAGPFVDDDPEFVGLLEELEARPRPADQPSGEGLVRRGHGVERGRIVAVAAAAGGAGATEVSLALAVAMRRTGLATALCDVDDQAPAIAQRLGLPLHPNIRTAVDAVHHGTAPLGATLHQSSALGIEVLSGLPNSRDWYELRAGEVAEVIADLARSRAAVIANIGSRVDDLPNLGGPARFGVARAIAALADDVVLVGTASPLAVRRIFDWLADARGLIGSARLHIVINQYPGGGFARGEIEAELLRTVAPSSFTVIPYDKRVTRAVWEGEPVARGPFTKAIEPLGDRLLAAESGVR